MEKPVNNYDIMKRDMQRIFVKSDCTPMLKRFGLVPIQDLLRFSMAGKQYNLEMSTGELSHINREGILVESSTNACGCIFDLLCYAKPDYHLKGSFKSIQNLNVGQSSYKQLGSDFFGPYSEYFDAHFEALRNACLQLNGEKAGKGDVDYSLPFFQDLRMRLQFWRSDEEFPASLTLMWDENVLQLMHYETLYYATLLMLEAVLDAMGATEQLYGMQ